jgi:hypothetical protein
MDLEKPPAWLPRRTVDELPLDEFFTFDAVLLVYQLFRDSQTSKAPRDVVWAILRARLALSIEISVVAAWWHENEMSCGEQPWRDGKKHGLLVCWYNTRARHMEQMWRDGKEHGLQTIWNWSGKKYREVTWRDGKRHGLETWWYDNGTKGNERMWQDGKRHGLAIAWNRNGKKIGDEMWQDGKPR